MSVKREKICYSCSGKFDGAMTLPALVIQCSDGRFGEAHEEFLHARLGLGRHDRLMIPGGPGALLSHPGAESSTASKEHFEDLVFLVKAHHLTRVVLICHDDCGFYLARRCPEARDLPSVQRRDLALVAKRLREELGVRQIEAYRAVIEDDHVAFEVVDVDEAQA